MDKLLLESERAIRKSLDTVKQYCNYMGLDFYGHLQYEKEREQYYNRGDL